MALLWVEGFEGIGVTNTSQADFYFKYPSVIAPTGLTVVDGRFFGKGCRFAATLGSTPSLNTPNLKLSPDATMVIGFAINFAVLQFTRIVSMYDSTTEGMNLSLSSNGTGNQWVVSRGSTALASGSTPPATSTWMYVEFKVLCDASVGTYELKVDGITILSGTGQNTKAGAHNFHDNVKIIIDQIAADQTYDDMYILDGSGSANKDFLGDSSVYGLLPDGDVTTQMTPSAGSTHNVLVNENPADQNTTYVSDSVSGHEDIFDFDDLTSGNAVFGLQYNVECIQDTFSTLDVNLPVNGVDGTAQNLAAVLSYENLYVIHEVDPSDSAAWTQAKIDALQAGVKIT